MKKAIVAEMATTLSHLNTANRILVPDALFSTRKAIKCIAGVMLLWSLGCSSTRGYTITGNNLYLTNGTISDVQAAINSAAPGSTIQIPNGSYTWSSGLTINQAVNLQGQSTGGVTITNNAGSNDLISAGGSTPFGVQISGLNIIQGSGNGTGRHLMVTTPMLLHDCYFETNGGVPRSVQWQTNGGVVWNCRFYSNEQDDSGIAFKPTNLNSSWASVSTMGKADTNGTANTYVEDCTFKDVYLQAMDFDDNSRAVVRHCTFDNSGIASHGQETSPAGARHWELYDNTFIFTSSGGIYPININYFFFIRGGTGIITNNVMPNIISQMWGDKAEIMMTVYNIRRTGEVPCQTSYPAARQMGQTWIGAGGYSYANAPGDGTGYSTDPVYIWGNTGGANYDNPGLEDYNPDQCGNGQTVVNYIKPGRDYITGTAKPGYAKYTYPHPLRSGAGTPSAPSQPQNLRVAR